MGAWAFFFPAYQGVKDFFLNIFHSCKNILRTKRES